LERVREENTKLKERLHANAWEAERRAGLAVRVDSVKAIVDLECGPLLHCGGDARNRSALKRKILAKWHPDKQPSQEHAATATKVIQELQNHQLWKLS
jgi:hypothetical protein